ncbi:MAG: O-antigen ligase family protein [Gaiellales bacterium]
MNPRTLDRLMLLPILVVTWQTVRLDTSFASLTYSDLLISLFLAAFAIDRLRRRDSGMHRAAAGLTGVMLVFLAVYLAGYFDLRDREALGLWTKGVIAWLAHAGFLVCSLAHVARRGAALYQRALRWFVAGIVICSVYGVLQLAAQAGAGVNLDRIVVGTITFGHGKTTGINVYGQVGGTSTIYRINALTGDPNHLGVILCVPLLMLLPRFLADPRRRRRLGALLVFLLAVQVLTLSRSAALGDVAGLAVLLPVVRRILPSLRTIALGLGAAAVVMAVAYMGSTFVHTVVNARLSTSGRGTAVHFEFYRLVPPALEPNPLFGMGFNTFAAFYEFITGRVDFGPHSFWVATLVETGMVGLCVYLVYFGHLLANAAALGHSADVEAARIGQGLLAALVGTAAANFFYLTMQFPYFFVVAMLVVGGALLYAPRHAEQRAPLGAPAGTLPA